MTETAPERPEVCWNCLEHKDTRVIGHGWYECEKCSVKWRQVQHYTLEDLAQRFSVRR